MQKSDFKKGQTVYLELVGYRCRDKNDIEKNIDKGVVKSVGNKYITVTYRWDENIKFEIDNDFMQKADVVESYRLYLKREDVFKYHEYEIKRNRLRRAFDYCNPLVKKLSEQDIDVILSIIEKYN